MTKQVCVFLKNRLYLVCRRCVRTQSGAGQCEVDGALPTLCVPGGATLSQSDLDRVARGCPADHVYRLTCPHLAVLIAKPNGMLRRRPKYCTRSLHLGVECGIIIFGATFVNVQMSKGRFAIVRSFFKCRAGFRLLPLMTSFNCFPAPEGWLSEV